MSSVRPGSSALLFTEAANCSGAADFVVFMTQMSQSGPKMGLAGGHSPYYLNVHLVDTNCHPLCFNLSSERMSSGLLAKNMQNQMDLFNFTTCACQ